MQGSKGCDTRIAWSGTLSPYKTDPELVAAERAEWEEKLGPSGDAMFVIICQNCGKAFWSTSGAAKFCSDECRHEVAAERAAEQVNKHKYAKDKRSLYARIEARIDSSLTNLEEDKDALLGRVYTLNEMHTCPHYNTGNKGLKCFYCKKGLDYPSMKPLVSNCVCAEHPLGSDGTVYMYDTLTKDNHRARYAVTPTHGRVRVDKKLKHLYYIDGKYYTDKEAKEEWKLPTQ